MSISRIPKSPPRPGRPFVIATPTEPFELVEGWAPVTDDQILSVEAIGGDEHTRPTVPSIIIR